MFRILRLQCSVPIHALLGSFVVQGRFTNVIHSHAVDAKIHLKHREPCVYIATSLLALSLVKTSISTHCCFLLLLPTLNNS